MDTSIPSPETSLEDYVALIKTRTDKVVKTAKELPRDIPFHRTLDRKFRTELDATSARVLRLTNRILKLAETLDLKAKPAVSNKAREPDDKVALADEEDVVDKFHSVVVDVFDPLLEHVDHCLDIRAGRIIPVRDQKPVVKEKDTAGDLQKAARLPQHILNAANLPKPQIRFIDKVDNANDITWRHHLTKLWHSKARTNDTVYTSHPYHHEITTLHYPDFMLISRPSIAPKSFEDTSFTYVDTKEGLFSLLDKLRQSEEIAIDLEHHSYRSYYGFVCLMQLSTRTEDFVVDCLVPEIRKNLEALNEVFTDPAKVKVLHGAESDIVWLQENFNLYIVNLFDTFHASRALELPRASLAFLLSVYCDFTADKRYQLADWRIRPLPSEMLHYARSDTHFLLFVYDQLREALIERSKAPDSKLSSGVPRVPSFVQTVLRNSAETSLREFVREKYNAETGDGLRGWGGLVRKWNKRSLLDDGPQRRVFLAVHKWRDEVAREEDESAVFVISNQALLTLIEKPMPTNLIALYTSFPGAVPPLIRKRGNELLQIMQDAAYRAPEIEATPMKTASDVFMEVEHMPVVIDAPRHTVFATQATPVPGLWSAISLPPQTMNKAIGTSRSSLFGNIVSAAKSIVPLHQEKTPPSTITRLSTRNSSFFGTSAKSTPVIPVPNGDQAQLAISMIHDAILKGEKQVVTVQTKGILIPAAPAASGTPIEPLKADSPPTSNPPTEVAFVPRSQRLTTQSEDNEIVQVGQRKKKRKRADEADIEPAQGRRKAPRSSLLSKGNAGNGEEREATPELQVFDYSAEPNILDEGMKDVDAGRGGRKGRQTKKDTNKGTRLDFKSLGLGPNPKQTNEPKSGNKSMTFR